MSSYNRSNRGNGQGQWRGEKSNSGPMVRMPPRPRTDGLPHGEFITTQEQHLAHLREWQRYISTWTFRPTGPNLPGYPNFEGLLLGPALYTCLEVITRAVEQDLRDQVDNVPTPLKEEDKVNSAQTAITQLSQVELVRLISQHQPPAAVAPLSETQAP